MVLSLEEEKELQVLKQKNKMELLETQHGFSMQELAAQLKIEAFRAYHNTLDVKMKDKIIEIIYDKEGKDANNTE